MAYSSIPKRLAAGSVPTSPGAVYTVPTTNKALLSSLSLHNASGNARVVSVWIVASGGSQDTSNKFVQTTLQDGDSYRENGIGQVLEAGDMVYMDTDGADVSYRLSGALIAEV
jgi:hypothetical protein